MIGKLKKKFVLINMSLVTMVLLIVFGVILLSNWQREQTQISDALRRSLEHVELQKEDFSKFIIGDTHKMNGMEMSGMPQLAVFTAKVDAQGNLTDVFSDTRVSVSEEIAATAVEAVMASEKTEGKLGDLDLQYQLQQQPDGSLKIAFADLSSRNSSMGNLLLTSLLVGCGGLLAFLAISLFLSDWVLRPVARAWTQQKQFVADASHELKTPLTVILANTDILLAHAEDPIATQRKWIEHTRDEAQRMKTMVEDLLFLARSDASPEPQMHTAFDLSDVAWSCLLPFEPVAFEQGVTLESEVMPELTLVGDAAKMKQLIVILLDNACKYAGKKGVVTFALEQVADKIRIRVNNTGEPIAPEHLPHLFERFYRTDKARARTKGGYGLGLSIAERIVTEHKGRIVVESDAEHGTTFTVVLPLK